jgi:hypothetical protein
MKLRDVVRVLAPLIAATLATSAHGMVLTTPVQVVRYQIYTDFGNGDVVFEVNGTFTGCYGFWLSPADAGYKQAYAALMTAKATGGSLVLYAYDTSLWPGSSNFNYCRVRSLTAE